MATNSHRSYRPTNACGNKLLQKRWDQTYYDEHRRLVRAAKPMVDSSAPRHYPHVGANQKKQQLKRERMDEIERDNLTLLTKMQHTMATKGSVDHRNMYCHHSLNELKRQREWEKVARENKAMLRRLQQVKPQYQVSQWIEDYRHSEELTERITAFPSASPASCARNSSSRKQPSKAAGATHTPTPETDKTVEEEEEEEEEEEGSVQVEAEEKACTVE